MDQFLQQYRDVVDGMAMSADLPLRRLRPPGSTVNPLSSCSVVQVEGTGSRMPVMIPRGTELVTKPHPACRVRTRFRTVHDVTIAPVAIASVRFMPCVDVPPALDMPPRSACAIAIAIEATDAAIALDEAVTGPLRLYIDADRETRAAFQDALFTRTLHTCVQAGQQWFPLATLPLAPAGMPDDEALPGSAGSGAGLLAEYLAFPERFDFFDIDLKPALAACPAGTRRLVLHVILPDLPTARLLQSLPSTMLRTGCTPVVCTNGDLPACMPIGRPGGDLTGDGIPPRYPMRFLLRPTASRLPAEARSSPWKLCTAVVSALQEHGLIQAGLPLLLGVLRRHAPAGSEAGHQLAGIVGLEHRAVTAWLRFPQGAAYLQGIEVRVTIDETAFERCSVFVFAQVMGRLLACHRRDDGFTRLVVLNTKGEERARCEAQAGIELPV